MPGNVQCKEEWNDLSVMLNFQVKIDSFPEDVIFLDNWKNLNNKYVL